MTHNITGWAASQSSLPEVPEGTTWAESRQGSRSPHLPLLLEAGPFWSTGHGSCDIGLGHPRPSSPLCTLRSAQWSQPTPFSPMAVNSLAKQEPKREWISMFNEALVLPGRRREGSTPISTVRAATPGPTSSRISPATQVT